MTKSKSNMNKTERQRMEFQKRQKRVAKYESELAQRVQEMKTSEKFVRKNSSNPQLAEKVKKEENRVKANKFYALFLQRKIQANSGY